MNKTFKKFVIFLLMLVLLLAGVFFTYNSMLQPKSKQSQDINFVVNANDNLTTITNKLEEEGIIKSAFVLKLYGKISNINNFVEGAFTLDKNWDAKEILSYLTVGTNVIPNEVTVTFQEGLWAKDIAEKISLSVSVSKEELLSLWDDSDYVKSLMIDYPFLTDSIFNENTNIKLEGYLAPNTYNFFIDANPDQVTRKLLDQTLKIYNKYLSDFESSKYSIHEIFTLASITQYESGNFEEDQVIAGIWYNRLDASMKLESSVTVCYALYEFEEWEDCERNTNYDSPYNTYMYDGIPPGPVNNPGEFAIKATLNPRNTNYFFFLADVKGDGKIYYSETFAEHSEKVNKYLR